MKNGVVIKVYDEYAVVCSKGEFIRIQRKKGLTQGQKIYFHADDLYHAKEERSVHMKGYMKLIAVAASVVLLIAAGMFYGNGSYASTLVVDINPSVELRLDEDEVVVRARSLNEDGDSLDLDSLEGMAVEDAIENITEQAKDLGFLDTDDLEDDFIVITSRSEKDWEDIEKRIEEKREHSELLKSAHIVLGNGPDRNSSDKDEKSVGMAAYLRAEYDLGEDETVGDFFSDPERREKFLEDRKARILEEDFEHEVERIRAHIENADMDEGNRERYMNEFREAKDEYMEALNQFKEAQKALQQARASGDEEDIEDAVKAVEEAQKEKERLEGIKDEADAAKDAIEKDNEEERDRDLDQIMENVQKIRDNAGKPEHAGDPKDVEDTVDPEDIGKPEGVGKPDHAGKPGQGNA